MAKTTYGLDLGKRVFQLYWVEPETGEVISRRFGRSGLLKFLANRSAGTVALEACGSAHWWARKLQALGFEVMLLHARFIRPFVQRNKTDAADAKAIWTAAGHPDVRTVAVKTEEQQAMLALHRMRSYLVKSRTAQVNQLRGLLYEFGVTLRGGRQAGLQQIRERLAELEHLVPALMFEAIKEQMERIRRLDVDIEGIERSLASWNKQEQACRAIADIPGIGLLTATALVATLGNPETFKSGREFAAFIGLVPRQNGTGGVIKLGAISKRGDPYLRTLLIHGARAVVYAAKDKGPWTESLLGRRPANVAIVALANKMARTAWAILAHGRKYDRSYVSSVPA